jgi:hypothetical protein
LRRLRLLVRIASPAGCAAVGPQPARVDAAARNLREASGGRPGLPPAIVAPTGHGPVGSQAARGRSAHGHLHVRAPGRRSRLLCKRGVGIIDRGRIAAGLLCKRGVGIIDDDRIVAGLRQIVVTVSPGIVAASREPMSTGG